MGERTLCTLRELCLDVVRDNAMRSVPHCVREGYDCVTVPNGEIDYRDRARAIGNRNTRSVIDSIVEKRIAARCQRCGHERMCGGPLVNSDCHWTLHKWEWCDCPDAVLTTLFDASAQWIVGYLETPRPASPLPPAIDDDDDEISDSDGICRDRSISDSLPPLRGDTWHRDPTKHWQNVVRWEDARNAWVR